jgi:hypothetical protein
MNIIKEAIRKIVKEELNKALPDITRQVMRKSFELQQVRESNLPENLGGAKDLKESPGDPKNLGAAGNE